MDRNFKGKPEIFTPSMHLYFCQSGRSAETPSANFSNLIEAFSSLQVIKECLEIKLPLKVKLKAMTDGRLYPSVPANVRITFLN